MALYDSSKAKLSNSILEMKFMKRTKDKVEKLQFEQEGKEYFNNELTTRMKKQSGQFILEPSYVFCENLIDGRLSFQGMNPEIERLMELEELAKKEQVKEEEVDVTDTQMAEMWQTNSTTKININNMKTRGKSIQKHSDEPADKKKKFLKPKD